MQARVAWLMDKARNRVQRTEERQEPESILSMTTRDGYRDPGI